MSRRAYNGATLDALDPERFDRLLAWLDPDREEAGRKHEAIRKRLIKIFVCRGSNISEELADNTIDRVARKIETILPTYVGDPANYFSAVATNILHESVRKEKAPRVLPPVPVPTDEEKEELYARMETCMQKLSEFDRDLVLSYYQLEKREKIEHRRKLAEQLGMGMNALRIRACRTRTALQECMESTKGNKGFDHV